MKRYINSGLIIVAIMSFFWAYTIADKIIREVGKDITFIDLGALYILGLITGLILELLLVVDKKEIINK